MTESHELYGIHYETGKNVRINISDGVIVSVEEIENEGDGNKIYIAPGLIDNQINGYANVDFSGRDLTTHDVIRAIRGIWSSGVTTFLPTLLTNSHKSLIKNLEILAEASTIGDEGKSIAGIHLEGPYISSLDGFRGCHVQRYIRNPSWSEFTEYQKAAAGKIVQITLAPELEGAIDFIDKCTQNGIVVALGHSNADAETISRAVNKGAGLSTHLGNGCANQIHRHNNPIWPQLSNDKLTASVIADGHHLTAEELKVFYKVKGPDNIILTSDIVYLSGMKPGKYSYLETQVILTDDGMLINPELQCLAGASFPLITGVGNMMKITECGLFNAIKMATSNVSAIYGLSVVGKLLPGTNADVIMFKITDNQINIIETRKGGNLVFKE
jgi:N-acetylglucosamine-6-phosphate deacetylase